MAFGPGRYSRGAPPAAPGIYRYVNKRSDAVDYVGQAVDLRKRFQEHLRGGPGNEPKLSPMKHHFEWKRQD